MRTTSEEVAFEQQNLWIIDERLTYHSLLTSDKSLAGISEIETSSKRRPDILIFDRPLVFSEGEHPLTSIVVIEFKRPDRTEYYVNNPVHQGYEIIGEIQGGKVKDRHGRWQRVSSSSVPAYLYVICDITPSLDKMLLAIAAMHTPDNQGYFGFNPNYSTYYEMMSYDKLLSDARKRNRVLFEKLHLPPTLS